MIAKPHTDSPQDSRRGFAVSPCLCGRGDRAGFAMAEKPGVVAHINKRAEDEGLLLQLWFAPICRIDVGCSTATCRSHSLSESQPVKCSQRDSGYGSCLVAKVCPLTKPIRK